MNTIIPPANFDSYMSEDVPFVGLFVDDSESMTKSDVSASSDKFLTAMAAQGIAEGPLWTIISWPGM